MTAGSPSTRASSDAAPVAWERDGHGYDSLPLSLLARAGFHLLTRVPYGSDIGESEGSVRMQGTSFSSVFFCDLGATFTGDPLLYASRLGLQLPGMGI